jgi:hypothetical protein
VVTGRKKRMRKTRNEVGKECGNSDEAVESNIQRKSKPENTKKSD